MRKMEIIQMLSGPFIGALIGYCTNYIAVKMLFRPLKPVMIGGIQLPFTPGIIPKRKPELAKAVGKAVGNSLLRTEDLEQVLISEEMKDTITEGIMNSLEAEIHGKNIEEFLRGVIEEEKYQGKREKLKDYATERVVNAISDIDIGTLLAQKGQAVLSQMGGMLAMFINEDTIQMITQPLGEKIKEYINNEGKELIEERISIEIQRIETMEMENVFNDSVKEHMKESIKEMYDRLVKGNITIIMKHFKIQEIVESKINDMDAIQLEKLVMSVMKNELGMIVNLGAIIGFVIGILNVFI